jgi:hypothetical protein
VLEDSDYELQPLPSDEAWFGEPDPSIYAAGTNDLTKEQLAQEVAKGNVCTLRQLKSHLLTATEDELAVSSTDPGGPLMCLLCAMGCRQGAFIRCWYMGKCCKQGLGLGNMRSTAVMAGVAAVTAATAHAVAAELCGLQCTASAGTACNMNPSSCCCQVSLSRTVGHRCATHAWT